MTEPKPAAPKPIKLIGLAALAGLLAGAVAVYVNGAGSVHGEVETAAGLAAECSVAAETAAKLNAAAVGDVAAMLPANPPKQLSSLAFNGADGKQVSLADFKGRTVLLNLWATWCVPCREEMPALDALQAKAGDASFEVVAVNVDTDTEGKRARFLAETGIKSLKDYSEPTMALFNTAKKQGLALGLPVTLLIGKDGCLLSAMNGPANWAGADALRLIATAKGL
ncbi:MAG: TlpA disulfide reductase family protein [Rhizobiaceae bacterium]